MMQGYPNLVSMMTFEFLVYCLAYGCSSTIFLTYLLAYASSCFCTLYSMCLELASELLFNSCRVNVLPNFLYKVLRERCATYF